MAFGGASTLNEFVRKTQFGIIFLTTFLTFLVIYWDLSGLYFYNTWNSITVLWSFLWNLLLEIVHIYLRHLLHDCTNMLSFWLSMLLLSFLIFISNASIINILYNIFESEVIFKTRTIKTKRTRTTFLNLKLLPSCNDLRWLILFDDNAS